MMYACGECAGRGRAGEKALDAGARVFARACAGAEGQAVRVGLPSGVSVRCRCAVRFGDRVRGLLETTAEELGRDVLLIARCPSIHTFGMAYAIDVAFLNRRGIVLASFRNVAPGCVRSCTRAFAALERVTRPDAWFEKGDAPFCP